MDRPQWIPVTNERDWDDCTERLAVPGGWLVRTKLITDAQSPLPISVAMAFVADPGHLGWGILYPTRPEDTDENE